MKIKNQQINFEVKAVDDESMTFSAYGNTKNYLDHAKDITVDGAYQKSIDRHKERGTMPKLLWSHDRQVMPIGVITEIKEDENGLLFDGKLADTQHGREVYELMKMGALDAFSIGYTVQSEQWDKEKQVNYLKEIDVKEISVVNFPCNDRSLLQDVKSRMDEDELPTKREVQKLLQQHCNFSKRQAESTMSQFEEKGADKLAYLLMMLEEMSPEQLKQIVDAAAGFLAEVEGIAPHDDDEYDDGKSEIESILAKLIS